MIEIEEKYLSAYEKLGEAIRSHVAKKRYPAMGCTSNCDLICEFSVGILSRLLKEYTPDAKLCNMKPATKIRTMQDFICTLTYYCANGIGGEVDIENMDIIKNSFRCEYAIGGTSAQAAMALSTVGCPSLLHLTDDSKEICGLLASPYIYTVSKSGELIHTDAVVQTKKQEIHCIMQYKKGEKIILANEEIIIPVSNRLILTNFTVNDSVPFSKPFFGYVEKNAMNVSSDVLSSFNAILDKDLLCERMEYLKKHITKYRDSNDTGIVFFEDAHYHNYEVKSLCMDMIYPYVDIVSLNEEELKITLGIYGFHVDINDILSCSAGIKFLKEKFRVKKGIIVHTKDYSMYFGSRNNAFDIQSGLIYGNLLATAKAYNGSYGTKEQLRRVLNLPLSTKGVENYKALAGSKYANEAVLVPTRYIDRPKYTVGLGDTFVAGLQICF